jgi:hypothetical protein
MIYVIVTFGALGRHRRACRRRRSSRSTCRQRAGGAPGLALRAHEPRLRSSPWMLAAWSFGKCIADNARWQIPASPSTRLPLPPGRPGARAALVPAGRPDRGEAFQGLVRRVGAAASSRAASAGCGGGLASPADDKPAFRGGADELRKDHLLGQMPGLRGRGEGRADARPHEAHAVGARPDLLGDPGRDAARRERREHAVVEPRIVGPREEDERGLGEVPQLQSTFCRARGWSEGRRTPFARAGGGWSRSRARGRRDGRSRSRSRAPGGPQLEGGGGLIELEANPGNGGGIPAGCREARSPSRGL